MAITTSYFAADLAAMIADLPVSARAYLALGGTVEFSASASPLGQEEELMLCGVYTGNMLRIIHGVESFTSDAGFKPQARMDVKMPDQSSYSTYEIVSISQSPDFCGYEVTLKKRHDS